MSRHDFTFNKNDLSFMDAVVVSGVSHNPSTEEYEEITVKGRNGKLYRNKHTYPEQKLVFEIALLDDSSEISHIDLEKNLYSWINNISDNRLYYSDNDIDDICYLVKRAYIDNADNEDGLLTYKITFICEPHRYSWDEHHIIIDNLSSPYQLKYKGSLPADTKIKIYGSGQVQLSIGDTLISVDNVDEYVYLDSKLLLCLNPDGSSKSRDMIGNFPMISDEKTEISTVGDVKKVEIYYRDTFR